MYQKYLKNIIDRTTSLQDEAITNEEMPIVAHIVSPTSGKIVSSFNNRIDIAGHAEINVINKIEHIDGDEIMFVTHEPCIMCMYAIEKARIKTIIYFNKVDENKYSREYAFEHNINYIYHEEKDLHLKLKSFFDNKRNVSRET